MGESEKERRRRRRRRGEKEGQMGEKLCPEQFCSATLQNPPGPLQVTSAVLCVQMFLRTGSKSMLIFEQYNHGFRAHHGDIIVSQQQWFFFTQNQSQKRDGDGASLSIAKKIKTVEISEPVVRARESWEMCVWEHSFS